MMWRLIVNYLLLNLSPFYLGQYETLTLLSLEAYNEIVWGCVKNLEWFGSRMTLLYLYIANISTLCRSDRLQEM